MLVKYSVLRMGLAASMVPGPMRVLETCVPRVVANNTEGLPFTEPRPPLSFLVQRATKKRTYSYIYVYAPFSVTCGCAAVVYEYSQGIAGASKSEAQLLGLERTGGRPPI